MVSSSRLRNATTVYGRVLLFLRSLPAQIRINLGVVYLKVYSLCARIHSRHHDL